MTRRCEDRRRCADCGMEFDPAAATELSMPDRRRIHALYCPGEHAVDPPEFVLRGQDDPFDHPDSRFLFRKPLVATPAALEAFGLEAIRRCYLELQALAEQHHGLDYGQAFDTSANPGGPPLWFLEDGEVVTALLPSDY